jgi:hypothetical protein
LLPSPAPRVPWVGAPWALLLPWPVCGGGGQPTAPAVGSPWPGGDLRAATAVLSLVQVPGGASWDPRRSRGRGGEANSVAPSGAPDCSLERDLWRAREGRAVTVDVVAGWDNFPPYQGPAPPPASLGLVCRTHQPPLTPAFRVVLGVGPGEEWRDPTDPGGCPTAALHQLGLWSSCGFWPPSFDLSTKGQWSMVKPPRRQ